MTSMGQESFNPEKELFLAESAERDECPACGNFYEGEGSCVECRGVDKKLEYLEALRLKKEVPLTEFEVEVERLKKVRPELANNKTALTELANINIAQRKPSKLKPPEDPNYH